jgi:hypothetical protein
MAIKLKLQVFLEDFITRTQLNDALIAPCLKLT